MSSRPYRSPSRQAAAATTRRRILDGAALLFVRDGFAATPMQAIADSAGVSVQSVRLQGTKAGLLMAVWERTFAGDEGAHPLSERPVMADIMGDPDTERALRRYVDFLVTANARGAAVWRAMHLATDGDADVRREVEAHEHRRLAELQLAAGWMASRRLIEPSAIDEVAAELAYDTSPDAYLHFVVGSGWSAERYAEWLIGRLRALASAPTEEAARLRAPAGGTVKPPKRAGSSDQNF